jgi:hypothetical protein
MSCQSNKLEYRLNNQEFRDHYSLSASVSTTRSLGTVEQVGFRSTLALHGL